MGFLGKLFGRSNGPADFWQWFATNASRFEGIPDPTRIEEFSERLRRIDSRLAFQMGRGELEISADGIKELIPVVREVVAAAPAIPGWTIHAFRQPTPGVAVEMGEHSYSANDVFFTITRDANGTHLDIFIAGADVALEAVGGIGFLLLDSTIGELAVMTKIQGIDFHGLAARPPTAKPLSELPQLLNN